MLIEKAIGHIREYVWQRAHLRLCEKYRNKYINHDVSIISMNCTGGILYHDLGLKFLSPTINLFFRAEDFIKFCENLDYYLSIDQYYCFWFIMIVLLMHKINGISERNTSTKKR